MTKEGGNVMSEKSTLCNVIAAVRILPLPNWEDKVKSSLRGDVLRLEVGLTSNTLYIYDHRNETIQAANYMTRNLSAGRKRSAFQDLKNAISEPARVIVTKKNDTEQVTLLPTSDPCTHLLSNKVLMSNRKEDYGFEFIEDSATWGWKRGRTGRHETSIFAIVSLTSDSQPLLIRTWGNQNGNHHEKEIIIINSDVKRMSEKEYYSFI